MIHRIEVLPVVARIPFLAEIMFQRIGRRFCLRRKFSPELLPHNHHHVFVLRMIESELTNSREIAVELYRVFAVFSLYRRSRKHACGNAVADLVVLFIHRFERDFVLRKSRCSERKQESND